MLRRTLTILKTILSVARDPEKMFGPPTFRSMPHDDRVAAATTLRDYVKRKRTTLLNLSARMPPASVAEVSEEIRSFTAAAEVLEWLAGVPSDPVVPELIELRHRNAELESKRYDAYQAEVDRAKVARQLEGAAKEIAWYNTRIGELMAYYQERMEDAGLEVDPDEFKLYPDASNIEEVPRVLERVGDQRKLKAHEGA